MTASAISNVLAKAASTDLTTLATVKTELNVPDASTDAMLSRWITACSAMAMNFTNRVFQNQLYQDQLREPRGPFRDQVLNVVAPFAAPLQLAAWPLTAAPSAAGTAAPTQPAISAVAGGALAATTYYVRATYVTPTGETPASLESFLAIAANNLLAVAAPGGDQAGTATGWNVYVGTAASRETLQASNLGLNTAWTEPTSGLVAGAAIPNAILVVETVSDGAQSILIEGVDFIADADKGQLTRLFSDGCPRRWFGFPTIAITVQYQAGFATYPTDAEDVEEAVILLVKARWFARNRDPYLRQENIPNVREATYWIAQGAGSNGALPPDVEDMLEKYRVPVIG